MVDNDFLEREGKGGKRGLHLTEEDRSLSYLSNIRDGIRAWGNVISKPLYFSRRNETRDSSLFPLFLFESNNRWPIVGCRYKDNRAYPWPGGESHFILYPESANQTIYAQKVRASDAGRYSCQARNDTTILEGDITLAVLGSYIVTFLKQYPALFV